MARPLSKRFDSTWRCGTIRDYYFWDGKNGPVIKSENGLPLPGGKWALVLPSVNGVIMYLKINPKTPHFFIDFVWTSVQETAEFSAEAGAATATASTGAGEATIITVEASEAAEVSFSLAGFSSIGTATTTLGVAGATDVAIGVGVAAETALLGGVAP
jgi:hypothetical protein